MIVHDEQPEIDVIELPPGSRRDRRASRWRLYGMSDDDYMAFYDAQNGRCRACLVAFDDDVYGMCVDHDHSTGIVRGLLCSPCNVGLGMFGDDPERLERAARYLRAKPPIHFVAQDGGPRPRIEEKPRVRGTHCRKGHPFTNRYADGTPYCPTCKKRRRDEAKVLVDHEGKIIS